MEAHVTKHKEKTMEPKILMRLPLTKENQTRRRNWSTINLFRHRVVYMRGEIGEIPA